MDDDHAIGSSSELQHPGRRARRERELAGRLVEVDHAVSFPLLVGLAPT
jgi:hypothetical protein